MSDVSANFAAAYLQLKQTFEDLGRLASDCGEALRGRGYEFTDAEEYSHAPNALVMKKNHAWLFSIPPAVHAEAKQKVLTFAACFAYFEADGKRWKAGPKGRPELWFFIGKVSPPPQTNWASTVQTFFEKADIECFDTKPALGGGVSRYRYGGDETWDAVCLGFDLAALRTRDDLERLAVAPLVKAAEERELI